MSSASARDYPHVEGGVDTIAKLCALLEPLGDEVVEKFFVSHAKRIIPE